MASPVGRPDRIGPAPREPRHRVPATLCDGAGADEEDASAAGPHTWHGAAGRTDILVHDTNEDRGDSGAGGETREQAPATTRPRDTLGTAADGERPGDHREVAGRR
ncbi:hypothetical protein GCM10027294_31130 [Marinactinospora endophytica]